MSIIDKSTLDEFQKEASKGGGYKTIEVGNQILKFKAAEVGMSKKTKLPYAKLVFSKQGYRDLHEYYTLRSNKPKDAGWYGAKAFLGFITKGLELDLQSVNLTGMDLEGYGNFLTSQLDKAVKAVVRHKQELYEVPADETFAAEYGLQLKPNVYFYGNDAAWVAANPDKLIETELFGKAKEQATDIELNTGKSLRTVDEIYKERKAIKALEKNTEEEHTDTLDMPNEDDLPF